MRYAVAPRQKALFDPAETMFSPLAVKHMQQDWPGIFRHQILHLMPVGKLAERFHPTLGCPTKELYSMAGAIFLKEFFNLTIEEAVQRYLLDARWHYALNVVPTTASLSHASIERYMRYFAEDDLAREVFHRVTSALVEALELGRVRTRGRPRVTMAVQLRCAGWNVLRALTAMKRRRIRDFTAFAEALRHRFAGLAWSTSCDTRRNVARGISGALKPRISLRLPCRKQLLTA